MLLILFICCVVFGLALAYWYCSDVPPIVGGYSPTLKNVVKDLKKHPRSKTEHKIITELEKITGKKFPTVNPSWLTWKGRTLELDGYNEELKLAIEVDGWWHHHWESTKEPYEVYFERVIKDIVKTKLCKRKGVYLIRVDSKLPSAHWRNYLLSRLYDARFLKEEPLAYIRVQEFESFRNEVIEKELGLDKELQVAKNL
jgi:hypothetical protein